MARIYATLSYQYLKKELSELSGIPSGEVIRKTFPDGEHYLRVTEDVEDEKIVLIGGTISEKDTLELYDLACGLVQYGAKKLHLIVPFYGYSTMERAVKSGEVVTAKTRARLLSSIPNAYFGNKITLIDLHVSGLQYYFEGPLRRVHLYAKPLIMEAAKELGGSDFVLASTDAGRAKWVESLANDMDVEGAFVYKRRSSGQNTQVTGINADVKDRTVIIYDDMIRTGGSLINAANAYKDAGAAKIFVIATHGLFPNNAVDRIQKSGLVEKVVVTNTHPNALEFQNDFLEVKSIAGLLSEHIKSHF